MIIGIDLGTTNSLAALWRDGRSELIPNVAGTFLTPSAVSIDEDGTVLVGQAARDRLVTHPERTAAGFKRHMGTDKRYHLGGRSFLPEELSALVLRRLKEDAERYLGQDVEEAVVSVPAYFAEAQRAATKRAGELAGLRVERLVNEPSAAAVAGHIGEGQADKTCLVFDFGGGTLDVSLVERFDNVVSVTAVSGDNQLGGRDFDEAIAQGFCEDCGLDLVSLPPRQRELLIRQAEACKMALTTQDPVLMVVTGDGLSASLSLSNAWLIRKCSSLFKRLSTPVQRVFLDGGSSASELDDLVFVGGSSHMPVVRQYICRMLNREGTQSISPDTAVALGAGICAGMKARSPDLRELVLTDVCPYTLGVNVRNPSEPERALMAPLIERNSVLPSSKQGYFVTVRDGQTILDFRVYQGEGRYCSDNTMLGKLEVPVPPAPQGEQGATVRFTYDINGLLEVEIVSKEGHRSSLVIQNPACTLSPQEAQQRLEELQALKLHPREQEANRVLVARGERLYAMTVGSAREEVGRVLDYFQSQLSTQEAPRVARAAKQTARYFDRLEEYLGVEGLLPPDWQAFTDGGDGP